MPLPTADPPFRSGFVAVVGPPNAGKSTLVNAWLSQSLAPVSPRPQTTIRSLIGVLTLPEAQVVLVDTPGIHRPLHRLGESMVEAARAVMRDANLVLVVLDASTPPGPDEDLTLDAVSGIPGGLLFAANKIDLLSTNMVAARLMAYQRWAGAAWLFPVSASTGDGVDVVLRAVVERLPPGPRYYEEDTVTDAYERDIAADQIRAACLELLRDEVPYQVAVRIDAYHETDPDHARIEATLLAEKESQKAIVIGKGGQMIKEIGIAARRRIEQMSGRKVYLALRVKTMPGWRSNEHMLKSLGYRGDLT